MRGAGEENDVARRLHDGLRARLSAGDRNGAIDHGYRLRLFLDEHNQRRAGGRTAWFLLTLAAEALMYEGKLLALTDLYKAVEVANAADNHELAARAFERIAVIHAAQGRMRDAEQVLRQESRGHYADQSIFLRTARALCAVERLDAAAGSLISASALDEIPDPYWPLLLLGRARWAISQGGVTVALDAAALGRTTKRIRQLSLADSTLLTIRATALTVMGSASTVVRELAGMSMFVTPELELARARAELHLGSSLRALGVVRRLMTSEDAGPSTRAEAMLISLQSDPANSMTIGAVRALVELEGIRRVMTTASAIAARQVWPDMTVTLPIPELQAHSEPLRDSELRVLEMLADHGGMTEIAERLHISKNTLKTHARAIYRKLGVASRQEAVAQGYLRGLLRPESGDEQIGR